LTSGEIDAVREVGPRTPATKRGLGRVAGGELVADRARQLGAGDVQLVDDGFEVVIGLRNAGRVEGVGFDDVRAGRQILGVDRRMRSGGSAAAGRCCPSGRARCAAKRLPR
jgi:hypothetical protein